MNVKLIEAALAASFLTMTSCSNHEKLSSGIEMSNLDTTVKPSDDFFQYACGGWMKNNPLPSDYSRFGTFDQLAENNREQINGIIKELADKPQKEGTVGYQIATLYNAVMDSVKQNQLGVEPLKGDLAKVEALKDVKELPALLAELQSYDVDVYFSLYVGADDKNSDMNIVHTYQSGLGLGERDYYLEQDDNMKHIRDEYKKHIKRMFELCGYSNKVAEAAVADVMEIENRLAKSHYSKVQLRDPQANYHKMAMTDFQKEFAGFDFGAFFKGVGLPELDSINLSQPEPIREAVDIMTTVPLAKQKNYMLWALIDRAATSLGDTLFNQNFEFFGRVLSGTKEPQPRWKRAVSQVSGSLGEAVGQMYVKKYFPEANKKRMVQLVKNLQTALGERMQSLAWMGDTTKALAIDKLSSFHVKIGYPDKWRDYSKLDVSGANLWELRKAVSRFNNDYAVSKAGKPVDKEEWHMTPQTVNAYYNPSTNEVCFPAGILQPPFFDMSADDAFNYGAIGVVIGHEMTHGFDDQGRQFDKFGNLHDWWTKTDGENFSKKARVMAEFFNAIEVAPGVHANGDFTLGENLADHGGLQISFQAYKMATAGKKLPVVNGLTADQRFFLAYAGVWAANITPEEILRRTKTDPHALGRWRVNGALPQVQAWYDAFGIDSNSPMYVAPEKRVSIW